MTLTSLWMAIAPKTELEHCPQPTAVGMHLAKVARPISVAALRKVMTLAAATVMIGKQPLSGHRPLWDYVAIRAPARLLVL
jgi:hypothetical protein